MDLATRTMPLPAAMDHAKTGGTLLSMKLSPRTLEDDEGLARLAALVRG